MKNSDTTHQGGNLNEAETLVLKIAKDYALPGGGINWVEAVKEHPEWRKFLQYDSHKVTGGFQKASNIANALRRKGLLEAARKSTGRVSKAMREKFKVAQQARREREALEAGGGSPAQPVAGAGSEVVTEAELQKMINRRVTELIDRVIEESAHCQKCGRSLAEQLRNEFHKVRYNR